MNRRTQVLTFTGITGGGKSTEARKTAKKLEPKGRVIVISYTGSGTTWSDCKDIPPTKEAIEAVQSWSMIRFAKWEDHKPLMQLVKYFRNGLVILDDMINYSPENWSHLPGLKQLLSDHRHWGLDIMFIAHAPNMIPRKCWAYVRWSFVFKCAMDINPKDINAENKAKFLAAQAEVNKAWDDYIKKHKKEPKGLHKRIRM